MAVARSSTAGVGDAEMKGARKSKTESFANANMIDASKQSKLIPLPLSNLKETSWSTRGKYLWSRRGADRIRLQHYGNIH
jgi:hypothetical protein